jgi:hypothetical protein
LIFKIHKMSRTLSTNIFVLFFLFVAFYFIDLMRCNVILSESKTLFFSVILTVLRKNAIESEE